ALSFFFQAEDRIRDRNVTGVQTCALPISQKQFFEETYDFLSERYGEENVLAGVVHNDETTPHMHFAFMPVTYDEKREREKVSAKEVLNRNELKSFHQDLDNHLKER